MMDWTDRHCRYFHRLLTKQTLLYTEMVTTGALMHGSVQRHLRFNSEEHPVALQLGGGRLSRRSWVCRRARCLPRSGEHIAARASKARHWHSDCRCHGSTGVPFW